MAEHFGLEYEPKPHWTECVRCGARRPPSSLKDGKCEGWKTVTSRDAVIRVVNRCEELALSKGKP